MHTMWEAGISMISFTREGEESTSPMPVIPASVEMRMTTVS